MKVHKYSTHDHYSILARWWAEHPEWNPVPRQFLPTGLIVQEDGGDYVCAGFIYKCERVPVWVLEWVVSNPKSDKRVRDRGLDLLFEALLKETKEGDLVWGFISHPGLIKRYMKHGFVEGDKANLTSLLRVTK